MTTNTPQGFPAACRAWRQLRKLSQLDLALEADVSQRHISWLETGRSQPSRGMVLRLSEAMEIPLRERNALLRAAGFAAVYRETDLDAPTMAPVLDALRRVLEHHEPLPAVVVDRFWDLQLMNAPARQLLDLVEDPEGLQARVGRAGEVNLALLTLHPEGLRPHIANWEEAAPAFIRRLRLDARASGDAAVQARLESYIEASGLGGVEVTFGERLLPVLPLVLARGALRLSLFSVISTFGTPQDVTTDELRIEAFYPMDEATAAFFEAAQGSTTA